MAQEKIQMPQSSGGLVSYNANTKSKIVISPMTVVIMICVVIVIAMFLHTGGFGIF